MADQARSTTALLPLGALGTLAPSSWRSLCSAEGPAKPRTVRIGVARSAVASDELAAVRMPAGVWWQYSTITVPWVGDSSSQCNGALRFRYGSAGVSRTLIADLAPGDYQIPSCEHLYVEATRYTPGTNASAIAALGLDTDTEVRGEISDGVATDFTPLLCTAPSAWGASPGADAAASIAVPQGAYAFELFADSPITTNPNTFELSPPGALRDFTNQLYQPSGPLPVLSNQILVQARGATPATAKLVFWVR